MANNRNGEQRSYVSALEEGKIKRAVQMWLNSCDCLPLPKLNYNYHGENIGLFLVPLQAPYITRRYILGGYEAQYQFSVDLLLPAGNDDERMTADEELESVATWAEQNFSAMETEDGSIRMRKLNRDTPAVPLDMLQSGAEIHSINFTLFYEVNV